eukprot:scpid76753/ scgid31994/ Uncharacterized protein L662
MMAQASVTFGKYVERGEHPDPDDFVSEKDVGAIHFAQTPVEAMAVETEGRKLFQRNKKGLHPLIDASHACFMQHLPLVLSPDIIWLTIAQGLSQHINSDPEKFRYRFVEHEGQLQLDVERHTFVRGSPSNDWPGVFKEFSGKIREYIGAKTHDLLVPTFSTTTPVSAAAAEIVLLEAMQSYFSFHCFTGCSIPSFTILGTVDDWRSIRSRVLGFLQIDKDLEWWTTPLVFVLDHFILAAEDKADLEFWKSWYKFESWSGGNAVTGAVLALFPYIDSKRNKHVDFRRAGAEIADSQGEGSESRNFFGQVVDSSGVGLKRFSSSLSKAPFTWHYHKTDLSMLFVSGLMGMTYDEDKGVKPVIGWAITDANTSASKT